MYVQGENPQADISDGTNTNNWAYSWTFSRSSRDWCGRSARTVWKCNINRTKHDYRKNAEKKTLEVKNIVVLKIVNEFFTGAVDYRQ